MSTPVGIGRFYLNDQLTDYQKIVPQASVEVLVEVTVDDVLAKKVDVAFIPNCPDDSRLCVRSCMDSFTIPLAARRYIKQHGMPKNPEDLINHIGLIKSGAGFPVTSRLVRANESRTVMWKKSLRYVDMLNIKDALVKGLGISLDVPLGMVLDEIKRGEVVKVLEDWHRPNWHCSVVSRAEDDDTTSIGKFATWYAQRATTEIDQKRNEGFRILSIDSTKI